MPAHGQDNRLHLAIARYKGRPVVVNFWATWCEPCRDEMPSLARLARRWRAAGLAIHTVAVADNNERVENFLWEILPKDETLPVLHDRDQTIGRTWKARVLPTTLVLDRRHRIVMRAQGAVDWDAPAVENQLRRRLHLN